MDELESAKLELERLRLDHERELRRMQLETDAVEKQRDRDLQLQLKRGELDAQAAERKAERDLQERLKLTELKQEQDQFNVTSKDRTARFQFVAPVWVAVIGGLAALAGSWSNGQNTIAAEKTKQDATIALEQKKQQGTLILEAIRTGGAGQQREKQAAANLVFLYDARLITLDLPPKKIEDLRKLAGTTVPSLPPEIALGPDVSRLSADLLSRLGLNPAAATATSTGGSPGAPGLQSRVTAVGSMSVPADGAGRYDYLQRMVSQRGFVFAMDPGHLNIIGVRQEDHPDEYDDVLFLAYVDRARQKQAPAFRATCDPGRAFTLHPVHPKGVAHIQDGQYRFQLGSFKGKPAVVQAEQIRVWRDTNKNFRFDAGEPFDTGFLSMAIHPGGKSATVGQWSAGCCAVFGGRAGAPWTSLFATVKAAATVQKTFLYTLITVPQGSVTPQSVAAQGSE